MSGGDVKGLSLGGVVVLLAAVALIAWRETRPAQGDTKPPALRPRVVLFADLSEEDEAGACGAIIHAVRAAAKRGIPTEEIDARDPGSRAEHYRLKIAPTVVILNDDKTQARRFEGEAPVTVKDIRAALERLAVRRPAQ